MAELETEAGGLGRCSANRVGAPAPNVRTGAAPSDERAQ
jgi:hypothetical protein